MKKSNYALSALYILLGCLSLYGTLRWKSAAGILYGLTGAFLSGGLLLGFMTLYWRRPENRERYEERKELAAIEHGDELKEKLRDKAGRQAYLVGLAISCIAVFIFSLLRSSGILPCHRVYVFYLSGYLLFQYIIGIILFNRLLKKYE